MDPKHPAMRKARVSRFPSAVNLGKSHLPITQPRMAEGYSPSQTRHGQGVTQVTMWVPSEPQGRKETIYQRDGNLDT